MSGRTGELGLNVASLVHERLKVCRHQIQDPVEIVYRQIWAPSKEYDTFKGRQSMEVKNAMSYEMDFNSFAVELKHSALLLLLQVIQHKIAHLDPLNTKVDIIFKVRFTHYAQLL